ncbi:MAG: methyl-accepting chemotaxis protein [Spirochaetia bacterium]|nr:methyl-accepting chemotaxis protein [Spirochaetia bacterium]
MRVGDRLERLKAEWLAVKSAGRSITVQENYNKHAAMVQDLTAIYAIVGDTSSLMQDSDRATFNVVNALINQWPLAAENLGRARGLGVTVLQKKQLTEGERARLEIYLQSTQSAVEGLERGIGIAFEADPSLKGELEGKNQEARKGLDHAEAMVKSSLLNGDLRTPPSQYFEDMARSVASFNELSEGMFQAINKKLSVRMSATRRNAYILVGTVAGILAAMLFFVLFIVRSITTPLADAVNRARDIAEGEGDLTKRIHVASKDEVGDLGSSMNKFIGNVDTLIAGVHVISGKLSNSSAALAESSQSLSAGTEQVSTQSQSIASSATQMNQNMQMLSSSIEEMSTSVEEVAKRAAEAALVANEAKGTTQETDIVVQDLGTNAREIGNVIETIAMIASQTNLLALNAAIEAASAGEAGKGFAVVAAEVKELARQTSVSSDEIKAKIAAIQDSSQKTMEAIKTMKNVIGRVNDISSAIASSVEEQSITAREIASNITQASSASSEVARNIHGISQASREGAHDAAKSSALAGDLHRMAADLAAIVNKFKFTQHAAGAIQTTTAEKAAA